MRKILEVARREFVETVKTKAFLIGLFLTPLMVGGVLVLSTRITEQSITGPRPTRELAVTDLSGKLYPELESVFEQYNVSHPKRRITLRLSTDGEGALMERVRSKELDGNLVIPKDVIEGGNSHLFLRAQDMADIALYPTVRRLVHEAVVKQRFRKHDVSPKLIAELQKRVSVHLMDASSKGERGRHTGVMRMIPFFFMFVMFMGVFGTSQQMLTSVIEEKSSRVMEMLLAALSPFELMAGKILGLTAVGLTLTGVWGAAAGATAVSRGMGEVVSAANLGYFLIYFILGFLLISSIFAAIGAACNTLKDTQSLVAPIMLMMTLPMVMWFYIAQNPGGTVAVLVSFIPPATPLVMILRISAMPDLPLIQIWATILVLGASVPVTMWAAAKIFRTGVLMYGKPPTPAELIRWLRAD